MAQKISESRILWPKNDNGRPRHKKFFADLESEFAGFSSFIECGNTNEGTEEVSKIMGIEKFIFPKPRSLIEALLRQTTSKDSLILDSFAGTGTTAHAVLSLNKEDGGRRRFILIEMEENICKNITLERLKRVINGYEYRKMEGEYVNIEGLGSGFKYCLLSDPLFDSKGNIQSNVKYSELAAHVYFCETGEPMPKAQKAKSPLIGIHNGKAIFLLFNGILEDKTPHGGNVLTRHILEVLPEYNGLKVIYGTSCRIGIERLSRENIIFRQIPYAIKVD